MNSSSAFFLPIEWLNSHTLVVKVKNDYFQHWILLISEVYFRCPCRVVGAF